MRTLYAVLIVAVVTACASVSPVKVQAGDTCYRCHRTIQDTRLAAEIVDRGSGFNTSYPFRSSGCLAKYLKQSPAGQSASIFVTDYNTEHMLSADSAWFVPVALPSLDGKKVEQDFAAFGSRADAAKFRPDAPVKRWADVLAAAVPD
jgi:hypothetical protein